jgi:general stress protein 26
MSKEQIRGFLIFGTLTTKISTVQKDGSPHEAPIWFILDNDDPEINVVLTTGHNTLKAKNILRDPRVSLSIVDQTPPFVCCNRGNSGNKSRIGFILSPKMDS